MIPPASHARRRCDDRAPLYRQNTRVAYQLNWSYALFWREPPKSLDWFAELQAATEPDHIRLLNHVFCELNVSKFLVSTTPDVVPELIPQRVKGRLQHLLQRTMPRAFQRNYSLRSIGSTKRDKVEAYVATQLGHYSMADERVQQRLEKYQVFDETVELSRQRQTSHAVYWYNLHLVFVMRDRAMHVQDETLMAIRKMICAVARKKGHLLSRAAILPDHVHLTIGCDLVESPEQVALSYLNNLAFAVGMKSFFEYGYWVGTFGEYDLGAV
jgi:REP element-mobilizing transposase RayT